MLHLPHDQEWTALALCAQTDPEIFHPEKGGSTREAKAVCAKCPVQRQCLDYVIAYEAGHMGTTTSYPTGIYGGLSAMERRPLIKAHRQDVLAATGTEAAVPIPTAAAVDDRPAVRQYGLPYVGGANGDTHYPLPNPDKIVHIEPRAKAKPSIDWDEIRRKHDERRRAEGTLDDQPTTTVVQLRCRWCRETTDELTNDLCPSCVAAWPTRSPSGSRAKVMHGRVAITSPPLRPTSPPASSPALSPPPSAAHRAGGRE